MNDRSERLRQRRQASKEKAQRDEPDEQSEPSKPSEPDETDEQSGSAKPSVKDEQVGRYLYLPERQNKRIDQVYNRLKADYEFEYDEELEKNRHYYPLLVKYGLEGLDGFDASDVRDALDS